MVEYILVIKVLQHNQLRFIYTDTKMKIKQKCHKVRFSYK